jgi:hypothetical protein
MQSGAVPSVTQMTTYYVRVVKVFTDESMASAEAKRLNELALNGTVYFVSRAKTVMKTGQSPRID